VGAKIGPLFFLDVPKKEKVASSRATFLTINVLYEAYAFSITTFPL
jgi:hypothetical protein